MSRFRMTSECLRTRECPKDFNSLWAPPPSLDVSSLPSAPMYLGDLLCRVQCLCETPCMCKDRTAATFKCTVCIYPLFPLCWGPCMPGIVPLPRPHHLIGHRYFSACTGVNLEKFKSFNRLPRPFTTFPLSNLLWGRNCRSDIFVRSISTPVGCVLEDEDDDDEEISSLSTSRSLSRMVEVNSLYLTRCTKTYMLYAVCKVSSNPSISYFFSVVMHIKN